MSKPSLRTVSHTMLFIVSMFFSVSLFAHAANVWWLQLAWVSFAISSEMLKEHMARTIKGSRHKGKSVGLFLFPYLPLMFISAIASLSFAQLSINSASYTNQVYNDQNRLVLEENINSINNDVEFIEMANKQIEALLRDQENIRKVWDDYRDERGASSWADQQEAEAIATVEEQLKYWINEKKYYEDSKDSTIEEHSVTEVENKIDTKQIFNMLGEPLNLSGDLTLFIIFVIVVIIIEFSLFITAEPLKEPINLDDILKGIKKIINDDGEIITFKESNILKKEFRNTVGFLSKLTWRGVPLLEKSDKKWLTKHKKNTIITYIETMKKMSEKGE